MSYTRWGSAVAYTTPAGETDHFASEWYIYWDVASDDSLGRNGQLLACWRSLDELPLIDYQELSRINQTASWNLIPGYEECESVQNRRHLKKCVREWLAEVESEYPTVPPQSRLEMAGILKKKQQEQLADSGNNMAGYRAAMLAERIAELGRQATAWNSSDREAIAELAATAKSEAEAYNRIRQNPASET